MRIRVDQLKCDTTGICVKRRPELFRFQEGSKKAEPLLDRIPLTLEKECRAIAKLCPRGAIIIEE
jgi:ferredoxin